MAGRTAAAPDHHRRILDEHVARFCRRVANEPSPFEKVTKLPVSRVRLILKHFLKVHAENAGPAAVLLSNDTVRIMTSLAYLMASCMAVLGWNQVPNARAGSNLKLRYMIVGTADIDEFDFLVDVNATSMELERQVSKDKKCQSVDEQLNLAHAEEDQDGSFGAGLERQRIRL